MTKTYQSKLFEFAYFPSYEDQIKDLAENIADHERWDFSDTTKCTYSILNVH